MCWCMLRMHACTARHRCGGAKRPRLTAPGPPPLTVSLEGGGHAAARHFAASQSRFPVDRPRAGSVSVRPQPVMCNFPLRVVQHKQKRALVMMVVPVLVLVLAGGAAADPCSCIPCQRTSAEPGNDHCGPAWHQPGTSTGCGPDLGNPNTGCYTNCKAVCECHGNPTGTCTPPPPPPEPGAHCDTKPGAPPGYKPVCEAQKTYAACAKLSETCVWVAPQPPPPPPPPCSGHGTIVGGDPPRCSCDVGYTGANCSSELPCGVHPGHCDLKPGQVSDEHEMSAMAPLCGDSLLSPHTFTRARAHEKLLGGAGLRRGAWGPTRGLDIEWLCLLAVCTATQYLYLLD
jgi:hypothetical protein